MNNTFNTPEIKLTKETFWIFNQGHADRFGLFIDEEKKQLKTKGDLFESKTAYNYHRFSPELENTDWEYFYRDLVEKLFKKYDFIIVNRRNEILGIKKGNAHLLKKHLAAYKTAKALIHS